MKILIIGSGGREHAIGKKLSEGSSPRQLYFAPGNAGTASLGQNVPIKDSDIPALLDFAKTEAIDLSIVGPEAPLVAGIVDRFEEDGLAIIGPNAAAAQLEGSKDFAKRIMKTYNIPTATYKTFRSREDAAAYCRQQPFPLVIKADGLAAGKGVTVAQNLGEATNALDNCFVAQVFGEAGTQVVIESFLEGEEASIFAFCDGKTLIPMCPAQDHKAAYDGDKGPNTGGMGAYSPAPVATPAIEAQVYENIFLPLINGLKSEGIIYKGILYAGLMIHEGQARVVEFNVRFGDPETQVVLERLNNDLLDIFLAIKEERLSEQNITWSDEAALTVVLASGGYPGNYEKNKIIQGLENKNTESVHILHAGTKTGNTGETLTNGGRVLNIVSRARDIETARETAYNTIQTISFENMMYRKDIAHKAINSVSSKANI